MLRMFMAPQTTPGELTLQADAATWRAVLDRVARTDLTMYAVLSAAVNAATGETVQRVTLPDDLARAVLQIAGVSA